MIKVINILKTRINLINYTHKHRKQIRIIEKQLTGKNSLRIYFHDLDKMVLYLFLGKKITSKIHHKIARHHLINAKTIKDIDQAIFDWESARFTKPDKPLNARETLNKYYPEYYDLVNPRLEYYKL